MRVVTVVLLALLGLVHAELWFGSSGMPRVRELSAQVAEQQARILDKPFENAIQGMQTAFSDAFASTGAFSIPSYGNDACLLLWLEPGNYTITLSGADGGTGIAIVKNINAVRKQFIPLVSEP